MSKKHTTKEKNECIQEYRDGKPINELLFHYSISKTTLYRWLQLQEVKDKRGIGVQVNRKTIAELDWQRIMLAIYQRTGLGTSSPFPDRVHAIQELNGEYSLNMLSVFKELESLYKRTGLNTVVHSVHFNNTHFGIAFSV